MYTLWSPPTPVVDESFKNYIQDFDSKMLLHGFRRLDIPDDFDYSTATRPVASTSGSPAYNRNGDEVTYKPLYYELDPNYFDPVVYSKLLKVYITVRFFIRDVWDYFASAPDIKYVRPFMRITISDSLTINGGVGNAKYYITRTNECVQWNGNEYPTNYRYDSLMYSKVDNTDTNNPVFIFGFILSPGYQYDNQIQTSLGLLCLEVYKDKHLYILPRYDDYYVRFSNTSKSANKSILIIGAYHVNGGGVGTAYFFDRSIFYKNTDNNIYPMYYTLNNGYVGTFKHVYCCRYGLYGPINVIESDEEKTIISFGNSIESHTESAYGRNLLIKI